MITICQFNFLCAISHALRATLCFTRHDSLLQEHFGPSGMASVLRCMRAFADEPALQFLGLEVLASFSRCEPSLPMLLLLHAKTVVLRQAVARLPAFRGLTFVGLEVLQALVADPAAKARQRAGGAVRVASKTGLACLARRGERSAACRLLQKRAHDLQIHLL